MIDVFLNDEPFSDGHVVHANQNQGWIKYTKGEYQSIPKLNNDGSTSYNSVIIEHMVYGDVRIG